MIKILPHLMKYTLLIIILLILSCKDDASAPSEGCTNTYACNYDGIDIEIDDGSCVYAEENFDCDGNCLIIVDCYGECGGFAEEDNCGTCDENHYNDCVGGEAGATLSICSLEYSSSNTVVFTVCVTSNENISGVQFNIDAPGFEVSNVDITDEASNYIASGSDLFAIAYSIDINNYIPAPSEGIPLIEFTGTYEHLSGIVNIVPVAGSISLINESAQEISTKIIPSDWEDITDSD